MIGVGTFRITDQARKYVNQVLESERLSYGPFTQKFEREFAAAHDSRFAIMTASGTCALMIALAALKNRYKWQDGDEVLVPAVTFIATSNVVLQLGMRPVFVDVEPIYYEIDPAKIEEKITPRTRAIIPVHLFGHPCDMDRIVPIAQKHGLRIIEDSCETMFTRLHGKSVGTFGDIGCFSTYVAHILTTGVGGLCTTNDPELAIALRSLMNHGRDSIYLSIDDDKDKSKKELEMIVARRFSFVQMGYSFRVTEMEGALGLAEFERHEEMMRKRWENGQYFIEKLKPLGDRLQLPTIRPGAGHAFMMFPIVLKNEPKTDLVNYLEQNGVETRDMLPLTNQPFYKELFGLRDEDYPVAKWINENGFYVASHQDLTDDERDYIVTVIQDYFAERSFQNAKNALVALSKGDGSAAIRISEMLPLASFQEKILVEGSGDPAVAAHFRKLGFEVISEKLEKGEAVRRAVDRTTAENVVLFGLDGSNDPAHMDRILIKLRQGSELVLASRFMPGGDRIASRPLSYRSIGNRFFSFLLSVIFSRNVTDCNNLYRGFKRAAYRKLGLKQQAESALFEMTLEALESDLKIAEVPTVERPAWTRRSGRNRFFTGLSFIWILARYLLNPSTRGKRRREEENSGAKA